MRRVLVWMLLCEVVRGTLMFPSVRIAMDCEKEISRLKMYGPACTRHAKYLPPGRVLNVIGGEGGPLLRVVLDAEIIGWVMARDVKDITNWE